MLETQTRDYEVRRVGVVACPFCKMFNIYFIEVKMMVRKCSHFSHRIGPDEERDRALGVVSKDQLVFINKTEEVPVVKRGRPKGSKDKKKRKRRLLFPRAKKSQFTYGVNDPQRPKEESNEQGKVEG